MESNEFNEFNEFRRLKVMSLEDFDLDNILIDEKSHENILIFRTSYKTLIGSKPLRIRFGKIDEIVRIYDGTRYLIFFRIKKIWRYMRQN